MASENEDSWKRRRAREDREDKEQEEQDVQNELGDLSSKVTSQTQQKEKEKKINYSSGKLDDLIKRADVLIEQLNHLYKMFATGIELRAPIERRSQLEQVMLSIQMANKPTPATLFRWSSIQSRYLVHKDKWDKTLKDIESGKIKRTAGPRRAA